MSTLTPKLVHELVSIDLELGGIHLGKLLESKSPSVKAGTETNGSVGRINTDNSHRTIVISIGSDDDVDVLNNPLESLVQVFLIQLQLQEGAVHFVHEKNGLDSLGDGLTQHGLGLHTDTCKLRKKLSKNR